MADINEEIYSKYLAALLNGKRAECAVIVNELLDGELSIRSLYVDLFQRSLYEIGDLWAANKISVAVEHMATAITENLVQSVYPRLFTGVYNGHSAVVACVANEHHQLGGKMVADILETHGVSTWFLGANTPLSALLDLTAEKEPTLVCLSLSVYMNFKLLCDAVQAITSQFPSLPVLVGGQAFAHGGVEIESVHSNVLYLSSLQALENYMDSME